MQVSAELQGLPRSVPGVRVPRQVWKAKRLSGNQVQHRSLPSRGAAGPQLADAAHQAAGW